MNSFAIHLFIDAFPSGWMKTIMAADRQPKPAYFAYREALTPLMANLRTDRYHFFSGDEILLEAWICNDLNSAQAKAFLHYQLELGGKVIFSNRTQAKVPVCTSEFQGFLRFKSPDVKKRSRVVARLALADDAGKILHDTSVVLNIFPRPSEGGTKKAFVVGARTGKAAKLAKELRLQRRFAGVPASDDIILIDDSSQFVKLRRDILRAVRKGAVATFLQLSKGKYRIDKDKITIEDCGMGPVHFVSRNTGHRLVEGFEPTDFRFWYDSRAQYVTPFLMTTFVAENWDAILTTGTGSWSEPWHSSLASAEKKHGNGFFRICQVDLANRVNCNPVAYLFAQRLVGLCSVDGIRVHQNRREVPRAVAEIQK